MTTRPERSESSPPASDQERLSRLQQVPTTPSGGAPRPAPDRSNIIQGSLWMIGITLALFFLPLINGFIGGLVGGYKVGSAGRALASAVLPAAIVSLGLWLLLALLNLPFVGFLAASAVGLAILFADVGLFIGALIGGALKGSRT